MGESEDYLDGLLNSVVKEAKENGESKGDSMQSEEEFMKDFENEIASDGNEDDFLKQFEKEIDSDPSDKGNANDDLFFENVNDIVDGVKQEMQDKAQTEDSTDDLDALVKEAAAKEEAVAEEEKQVDHDQDLMDLLKSEDGLSDIGDMLNADEAGESIEDDGLSGFDDISEVSEDDEKPEETEAETAAEKPKKEGFFAKLGKILFGEDEDEEEKTEEKVSLERTAMPDIEDLTDENLQILQSLEGTPEAAEEPQEKEPTPEEIKAKKKEEKKKKKEEKEKKKKEKKEQKAKKPKKERPKKEKLPKEPDLTPPLPKVPVILIFIMAASFFALVMIATNLLGYSNSFTEAADAYSKGNYEEAYQQVAGVNVKEADSGEYEKYKIIATIDSEYKAYESLMQGEVYDMALDSLIRAIGRCDKYEQDAATYGCAGEVEKIKAQAVEALAIFGISEEDAMNLYGIEDRKEYSKEIYNVLTAAGLEKVTEE